MALLKNSSDDIVALPEYREEPGRSPGQKTPLPHGEMAGSSVRQDDGPTKQHGSVGRIRQASAVYHTCPAEQAASGCRGACPPGPASPLQSLTGRGAPDATVAGETQQQAPDAPRRGP
jgi:hypothetical protein